jgi:hypothetical protein
VNQVQQFNKKLVISGRLDNSSDTIKQSVLNLHISVEEKFDVARFWQLETIGIQPLLVQDSSQSQSKRLFGDWPSSPERYVGHSTL